MVGIVAGLHRPVGRLAHSCSKSAAGRRRRGMRRTNPVDAGGRRHPTRMERRCCFMFNPPSAAAKRAVHTLRDEHDDATRMPPIGRLPGSDCAATCAAALGLGRRAPTRRRTIIRRVRAWSIVNECIAEHGDSSTNLYQCSCAIDRIAEPELRRVRRSIDLRQVLRPARRRRRDVPRSDEAKQMAKRYRETGGGGIRSCGLGS